MEEDEASRVVETSAGNKNETTASELRAETDEKKGISH
jgi:hypothetical protein